MHEVKFSIIIGSGNVGEALINCKGFDKHNIKSAGVFDIDLVRLKKNYSVPIYPMENLREIISTYKVKISVNCRTGSCGARDML